MVRILLKLEGMTLLVTALFFYHLTQGNWILFIVLLLTPDISAIGYLKDKEIGAIIYNIVHNYVTALVLVFTGFIFHNILLPLGIILFAHVGMDRFFGFGLKYQTHFKDTHLQRV